MARRPRSDLRRGPLRSAAAGLVLALFLGCPQGEVDGERDREPSAARVDVVRLEPQLLRNVVKIPGQLVAEMTVEIVPETEGVIASVEFAEGQRVTKGQVLLRLGDAEERARLREAQAERELAAAVYERTRSLKRQDVSSAAQLERAAAELEVARSRVQAARVPLERTRIRAPFDGVMGDLYVSPGQRVTPDDRMVRIDALDRLQLMFHLPELAVGQVHPGIPVSIQVAPFPDRRFEGEVYFVSPSVDPAARRLLVKAWLPNPDHLLRPGLFAEIEAEVARRDDALLVPEAALLHALDGSYVWRVGVGERVERVAVELGLRDGGRVEVARGLAPGDRIVANGVHKVSAGDRVRTQETAGNPLAGEPDARAAPVAGELEAVEDPAASRRES